MVKCNLIPRGHIPFGQHQSALIPLTLNADLKCARDLETRLGKMKVEENDLPVLALQPVECDL